MKRALSLVLAALLAAGAALAAAESVNVIVKKTAIRGDRQFYAPAVGEAAYGDKLTVLDRQRDWIKVDAAGTQGWVHSSAVSQKAVKASAGGGAAVSSDEVALAGKGFNSQVESEYRKKNPEANFAAVDRMEKVSVPDSSLAGFVQDGHLEPRGAGK